MSGPMIELLDNGPDDPVEEPFAASVWRQLGRSVRVLLVAALVVGALGGAVVTHALIGHPRVPAAPPAPSPTTVDAVLVIPTGGVVTSSSSVEGTVAYVDVSLTNQGGGELDAVHAHWVGWLAGDTSGEVSDVAVGRLTAGSPTTVHLGLSRPCASGEDDTDVPPALLLTWTGDSGPGRLIVEPFGLDRLWANMHTQCPLGENGSVSALSLSLRKAVADGPKQLTLLLSFQNLGHVDLKVNLVYFGLGLDAVSTKSVPFTVQARGSSDVAVGVRVTDCKAALDGEGASGSTYRVWTQADGPVSPSFMSDDLTQALGGLVSRTCGTP